MNTTDEPITVEQNFKNSIADVWNAITNHTELTQWFFDNIPAFEARVGFETSFPVQSSDRTFTHIWTVTEVIPNKMIKYNWKYKEYPGDSFVTFEISEKNGEVNLKLETEILESFPQDIPEFKRESGVQGWTFFINERLKNYMAQKL